MILWMPTLYRLRLVWEDVTKADPQSWNQFDWHCGSSHCFAGHAEILATGKQTGSTREVAKEFLGLNDVQADYLFHEERSLEDFESILMHPLFIEDIDALKNLSKHEDSLALCWIAGNPNCPADLLEVLSEDEDPDVRYEAVKNPNCSTNILEVRCKDKHYDVRCGVAGNSNCPVSILRILHEDEDFDVRRQVAKNPNCPMDTLEILRNDKNSGVRLTAEKNLISRLTKSLG